MLGQRLSNEQSNVGPTKYVAVGPTLNQRLGFGWRMVSVLAGMFNGYWRECTKHRLVTDDRGNETSGGSRAGTSRALPIEGTTRVSYYKSIFFI